MTPTMISPITLPYLPPRQTDQDQTASHPNDIAIDVALAVIAVIVAALLDAEIISLKGL